MASRIEKEKFFAQLDGLDESTETESESDPEERHRQQTCRKRRKLNIARDVNGEVFVSSQPAETVDCTTTKYAEQSLRLRAPTGDRISMKEIVQKDTVTLGTQQRNANRNIVPRPNLVKQKPDVKVINTSRRLFENLTFYFIPNDDVAKPRKLRIQSAISQGAIWARKLEHGVTHVIVDPDISATAVVKYINKGANIPGVAFVKMNWLIESLGHKSLRNPRDSRFQLKGGDAALSSSRAKPLLGTASSEAGVIERPVFRSSIDVDISHTSANNEIDQIVRSLRTATNLPFDEELDLDNLLSFSSGDEQAQELQDDPKESKSIKNSTLSGQLMECQDDSQHPIPPHATFQCMQSNLTQQNPSPNDRTISVLQQMATYYDRTGDDWRTLAYRRAITALRKHNTQVKTAKQARSIHGIGTRLAEKIEEIVTTDRLKRLDVVLSDPDDEVLQLFMGIYGAGIRQARAWMEQGYRTLEDLVQNAKLSTNQKIGIDHHADFAQQIPRSEVKQHGQIVAQSLKLANRDLQAIVGGSYRRGMPNSGDIDVIITHPTATLEQLQTWVFDIIVPHLLEVGFMKCTLATSRPSISTPRRPTLSRPYPKPKSLLPFPSHSSNPTTTSGSKFLGASQLPPTSTNPSPPWRRIDLLLVPPTSLGAALIYFTGNDIFNRSLRLLASKKGMRLNQHGLYRDVMRGERRVKITEGELVEGRSEKRIFEVLGVPWREANERSC